MPESRPGFFGELLNTFRNSDKVFRNLTEFFRQFVRNSSEISSEIRQKSARISDEFLTDFWRKSSDMRQKLISDKSSEIQTPCFIGF